MNSYLDFESLRRENSSWWSVSRRKLLREMVATEARGERSIRVLDLGCAARLEEESSGAVHAVSVHGSLPLLAFRQMEGARDLICSRPEELSFSSNSFNAVVAGDVLQYVDDDVVVLRELRRVLKDGGLLCLTVPAFPALWGEYDERRHHRRRYTSSELRRQLTICGFDVQRVSYFVGIGFFPAMAARAAKDIFRKDIMAGQRDRAPSAVANAMMSGWLDIERHLMHYINLPFGTRMVCWAHKPALLAERVMVPAWERQWARRPLPQGSSYWPLPEN